MKEELTESEKAVLRQLLEENLSGIFIRETLAIVYRTILHKLKYEEKP
jgi:hypothetical protein